MASVPFDFFKVFCISFHNFRIKTYFYYRSKTNESLWCTVDVRCTECAVKPSENSIFSPNNSVLF